MNLLEAELFSSVFFLCVLCDCDYPDSTYGITQSKDQIDRSIAFVKQYL